MSHKWNLGIQSNFLRGKLDSVSNRLTKQVIVSFQPPSTKDIPADFRITFMNNNPNPLGVLGSKCVGEPPLCLSVSVKFAVERAIESALLDIKSTDYFQLSSPATPERISKVCRVDISQMTFS